MNHHTVASYNMSWASATGYYNKDIDAHKEKISEYTFLKRATKPHQFWNQAVRHLMTFMKTMKPSVVGLQEMIDASPGANQITSNPYIRSNYNFLLGNAGVAYVLTLWDKRLGDLKIHYTKDLEKGRPISIIYTTKNYLLVNLHAPHLKHDEAALSSLLNKHFDAFLAKNRSVRKTMNPSKLYVTGDFNYGGFKNTNRFVMGGHSLTTGTRKEIKSCCHVKKAPTLCKYRRGGDYCMGLYPVHPLTLFPSPSDVEGGSTASDHELVWATFEERPFESADKSSTRRRKKTSSATTRRNL